MIYLIYGEDRYQAEKAVRKLLSGVSRKKSLATTDLRDDNWRHLLADQVSLFGGETAVVFRNILDQKLEEHALYEDPEKVWAELAPPEKAIFWQEGKVDGRLKIVKWLKKEGEVKEFSPLKPSEVKRWVKGQTHDLEVEPAAINRLVELHGNNLYRLENEIKKIRAYVDGGKVSRGQIEELSGHSVEENIFDFVDSLSRRDRAGAAALLNNLLREGQDPSYLFAMVVRQFRLLILAHFPGGLKGQHPYVVKKVKQFSGDWELSDLRSIYKNLLEIDVAAKFGALDLETQLWLLIAGL